MPLGKIQDFVIGQALPRYRSMELLTLIFIESQLNNDICHHFVLALVVRRELPQLSRSGISISRRCDSVIRLRAHPRAAG
jgi:hypothetical protein